MVHLIVFCSKMPVSNLKIQESNEIENRSVQTIKIRTSCKLVVKICDSVYHKMISNLSLLTPALIAMSENMALAHLAFKHCYCNCYCYNSHLWYVHFIVHTMCTAQIVYAMQMLTKSLWSLFVSFICKAVYHFNECLLVHPSCAALFCFVCILVSIYLVWAKQLL